jgi:hypothetical protein
MSTKTWEELFENSKKPMEASRKLSFKEYKKSQPRTFTEMFGDGFSGKLKESKSYTKLYEDGDEPPYSRDNPDTYGGSHGMDPIVEDLVDDFEGAINKLADDYGWAPSEMWIFQIPKAIEILKKRFEDDEEYLD